MTAAEPGRLREGREGVAGEKPPGVINVDVEPVCTFDGVEGAAKIHFGAMAILDCTHNSQLDFAKPEA